MPKAPVPEEVKTVEMDELFTFSAKKDPYIYTLLDRQTRCYLGWKVLWGRTQPFIQELEDDTPKVRQYFSDAFDVYDRQWYPFGRFEVSQCKTDTCSVEADNAELLHYLARLTRTSRCFSPPPLTLKCALC